MYQQQLPNITPQAMDGEKNLAQSKPTTKKENQENKDDYKKNYLNVMLGDKEKEKTLNIRLLPIDVNPQSPTFGTPFVHVYTHNVKVPKEVAASGWKNYLCLYRTIGIDHSVFGNRCPFCELNKTAYEAREQETDPAKKKELTDLSCANKANESIIVRCIDRDHEDEGVKFWKFNIRKDKTDPFNQINYLYEQRKAEGERVGVSVNILDIYNGFDLTVKITEGNSAPVILAGTISCPVSRDEQQMYDWIYDNKKWQDVFSAKSYEYLSLVSAMKIPWKDKQTGMWVDKDEFFANKEAIKRNSEMQLREADMTVIGAQQYNPQNNTNQTMWQQQNVLMNSMTVNDSQLPM